jgi:hypothetical protein
MPSVPVNNLFEIDNYLRAIESHSYASGEIPENPLHRNPLDRKERKIAVEADNPVYGRMKLLEDVELFGHDPERFNNYVRGLVAEDLAVDIVVVRYFHDLGFDARIVEHVGDELRGVK